MLAIKYKWMLVESPIYLLDMCLRTFLIQKFRGVRINFMEIKYSDTGFYRYLQEFFKINAFKYALTVLI